MLSNFDRTLFFYDCDLTILFFYPIHFTRNWNNLQYMAKVRKLYYNIYDFNWLFSSNHFFNILRSFFPLDKGLLIL
jgi:hypothetical protein